MLPLSGSLRQFCDNGAITGAFLPFGVRSEARGRATRSVPRCPYACSVGRTLAACRPVKICGGGLPASVAAGFSLVLPLASAVSPAFTAVGLADVEGRTGLVAANAEGRVTTAGGCSSGASARLVREAWKPLIDLPQRQGRCLGPLQVHPEVRPVSPGGGQVEGADDGLLLIEVEFGVEPLDLMQGRTERLDACERAGAPSFALLEVGVVLRAGDHMYLDSALDRLSHHEFQARPEIDVRRDQDHMRLCAFDQCLDLEDQVVGRQERPIRGRMHGELHPARARALSLQWGMHAWACTLQGKARSPGRRDGCKRLLGNTLGHPGAAGRAHRLRVARSCRTPVGRQVGRMLAFFLREVGSRRPCPAGGHVSARWDRGGMDAMGACDFRSGEGRRVGCRKLRLA